MITSKGEPIFAHVNMHGFRWKFMAPSSSRAQKSVMKIAERSSLKILPSPNTSQYDIMQTEKLMKAKCNNAKLYWKMLTGKNNKQNTCPITCKEFYNHFLKLSDPEDNFFQADREISGEMREVIENDIEEMYAELNVPMNESELRKAVIELKCGKSGGEDLIINELLMNGFSVLCPYMLQLFNFIFEAGIFPEMWGNGLLVPLHKKGSMSVTDNYRGITLLSALGKLFTRVLNNRLDGWAEAYGIYLEAQNGFRKGRGTTDSLFIIQNVINEFIENGKKLYVFFVDYSKAFDFVVHDNLWYKLLQYGIRGKIFNIIHSMYQYVKTKVFSNGITSDPFHCKLWYSKENVYLCSYLQCMLMIWKTLSTSRVQVLPYHMWRCYCCYMPTM